MGRNTGRMASKRVLCAFSGRKLRQEVTRRLDESGFATWTADSTEKLIRAVAKESPDVLLLDAGLGGDDGDSLDPLLALRKSKVSGADLPTVLFLRNAPSDTLRKRSRWLGAIPVSNRRLSTRGLRSLVEQALELGREGPSEGDLLSICERLRSENPFTALGLDRGAQPEQIARVYQRLHRWLDPDALGRRKRELREVVLMARGDLERAYASLSDPDAFEAHSREPERPTAAAAPAQQSSEEAQAARQYRSGQKLLDEADYPGALGAFERAAELCPRVGEYRACIGWALYLVYGNEETSIRQAIAHAKAGMKLAPDHYHPALVLGRLYQCTSRLDLATKAFERAVQLNPQSIEAVRELRIMRMREKDGKNLISRLLRK